MHALRALLYSRLFLETIGSELQEENGEARVGRHGNRKNPTSIDFKNVFPYRNSLLLYLAFVYCCDHLSS